MEIAMYVVRQTNTENGPSCFLQNTLVKEVSNSKFITLAQNKLSQIYSVIWNITVEPLLVKKLSDPATVQIAK